jgi:hypothetical protein
MHRVSENKGWTHREMLGEKKRVIFRYFNYIIQDNEDEKERIEKDKEEAENERIMAQKKKDREEWMQGEGKLG